MPRYRLYLPLCIVILAASCGWNDERRFVIETEEMRDDASVEPPASAAAPCVQTIAVPALAAHEPEYFGPLPIERTSSTPIRQWVQVEHLPDRIAIFDSVFWEPKDTESLLALIAEGNLVKGKSVLEIGTGSGLLSLHCLQYGANKVVATDINPMAVKNARYNAKRLGLADRIEVRLVSPDAPDAYSIIQASERFDLIISNPPWEDATPRCNLDYAFYDPGYGLLRSLLGGLPQHMKSDGRALLAYGAVDGIREVRRLSAENGYRFRILDDRDPEAMPPVFVPGMLLELSREATAKRR